MLLIFFQVLLLIQAGANVNNVLCKRTPLHVSRKVLLQVSLKARSIPSETSQFLHGKNSTRATRVAPSVVKA